MCSVRFCDCKYTVLEFLLTDVISGQSHIGGRPLISLLLLHILVQNVRQQGLKEVQMYYIKIFSLKIQFK